MNTKSFSFGRNQKLKGRKNIETLFQNGKAFFVHPYRVVFLIEQSLESGTINIGIGVPKKHFKLAVNRNKIKRQTREAYRLQQHIILPILLAEKIVLKAMISYSTAQAHTYTDIEKAMNKILHKLLISIENNK